MRTALIVDAACDLPADYCVQNDIHILPMGVVFAEERYFDQRDSEVTRNFYNEYSHYRAKDTYSLPPSVDVISSYILENIAGQYDQAFIMCLSSSRSRLYKFAVEAGKQVMQTIRDSRERAAIQLKNLRIMDTQTVFTGQAVLAYEAQRVVAVIKQVDSQELYEVLRVLSENVNVYTIPDDLYYVRARANLRGERSYGKLSYAIGRSFDVKPIVLTKNGMVEKVGKAKGFREAVSTLFQMVKDAIDKGLMINTIMLSYAGDTREITGSNSFKSLQGYAENEGVKVYISVMSTAAGINVGPGALSVSYCG
ncbi:MAG: DegV family protein [bacterium]